MEEFLAKNALTVAGFIATGGVALWRISALERRAREDRRAFEERQAERERQAREDRRALHQEVNVLTSELSRLDGFLRGAGILNGGGRHHD